MLHELENGGVIPPSKTAALLQRGALGLLRLTDRGGATAPRAARRSSNRQDAPGWIDGRGWFFPRGHARLSRQTPQGFVRSNDQAARAECL